MLWPYLKLYINTKGMLLLLMRVTHRSLPVCKTRSPSPCTISSCSGSGGRSDTLSAWVTKTSLTTLKLLATTIQLWPIRRLYTFPCVSANWEEMWPVRAKIGWMWNRTDADVLWLVQIYLSQTLVTPAVVQSEYVAYNRNHPGSFHIPSHIRSNWVKYPMHSARKGTVQTNSASVPPWSCYSVARILLRPVSVGRKSVAGALGFATLNLAQWVEPLSPLVLHYIGL